MTTSVKGLIWKSKREESTRSRMSRIWASAFCSSSVGLGEMLELVENCE